MFPLWAVAIAARYLKYLPVIGWRFSDSLLTSVEARMDRDVEIADVTVEPADESPPTDLRVDITVRNELPVDIAVAAVNVRIGYDDDGKTVANVLWSDDSHGSPPKNVSAPLVERTGEETVTVERYLAGDAPGDAIHIDGSITTEALIDVPLTRRVPFGTLEYDLPAANVELAA